MLDSRCQPSVRWILSLVLLVAAGCGASAPASVKPKALTSEKFKGATRCDASKPGRELSYHDLGGRGKPDMVEVIGYVKSEITGSPEGRVICMEVDTNHDGTLDLLREFGPGGEIVAEEIDRNFDGKSDLWVTYEKGFIAKQVFDTTFSGKQDAFHYYRDGKLKRIERDRNGDGKIDVWEFYVNGRLERMGVDQDFDGRVDDWYRDEVARAEKKATSASSAAAAASSAAPAASGSAPAASSAKK